MDSNLEQRVKELERKLAQYERFMTITPTRVVMNQSVLIQGMVNADRVYTKRSGNHIELIT
jgi:uncharacterized coiled-coil protein SlyX